MLNFSSRCGMCLCDFLYLFFDSILWLKLSTFQQRFTIRLMEIMLLLPGLVKLCTVCHIYTTACVLYAIICTTVCILYAIIYTTACVLYAIICTTICHYIHNCLGTVYHIYTQLSVYCVLYTHNCLLGCQYRPTTLFITVWKSFVSEDLLVDYSTWLVRIYPVLFGP